MNEGEFASRLGLLGIPREAETIVLERDMQLVALTGARYHAALVTTAGSLEIIRKAKARGLPVTCATSINHLTLNENDIGDYRTFLKLAPPVAPRGGPARALRGSRVGARRLHRVGPRSAGRRGQAPAVRRGRGRSCRSRDDAACRAAARDRRPRQLAGAAAGDVVETPPASCACRRGGWKSARPRTSSASTPTSPSSSIRPSCARAARIRRSTRRAWRAG